MKYQQRHKIFRSVTAVYVLQGLSSLKLENFTLRRVSIITLFSSVLLTGCSTLTDNPLFGENGLIHDRSKEYQSATPSSRLQIPAELNAKQTRDAMDIPQRQLAQSAPVNKVKRPEYFYADSGSESVNFKQDGTGKVLLVDAPISEIWPKAQQFMEFNNLGISQIDPQKGTIESDWVVVKGEEVGVVDGWLKKLTFQNVNGDNKNKIRIKLKTDKKSPLRTVISMDHVQFPESKEISTVDWNKSSQHVSYKTEMLYELLRFMSKATNGSENSGLLASKFKRSQRDGTVLFGRNANGKPALKISGSLENAWRLVDNSLKTNQLDVGTKDRNAATFYLTFTSLTPVVEDDRSFLDWLHGDRGPLTFSSFSFGGEDNNTTGKNIAYSSKGQIDSSKELLLTDPNHPANQEGFKVWLAGKVVYNFNRGFNKGFFNLDSNLYELTAGYQLKLTYRGNSTFISVLDKKGEEAASIPAEELLWRIKDSIPRA
jgi:uncharacterized lipoprotein